MKRAPVAIPPVPPTYTWIIIKPDGTTVAGDGPVATVLADAPGTYSCVFTATADRDCPPASIMIGPVYAFCDDPCSPDCINCDDGDLCTNDGCAAGNCWTEPKCDEASGETCCPNTGECCLSGQFCCVSRAGCCPTGWNCCTGGACCAVACEACMDNGSLSGGTITIQPDLPCPEAVITFTLSGVTDSGGTKRVNCRPVAIPPSNPPMSIVPGQSEPRASATGQSEPRAGATGQSEPGASATGQAKRKG